MTKLRFLMALALLSFSVMASAATIQGTINFGGTATIDTVANTVDVLNELAAVTHATDDFATYITPLIDVATYNDFAYDPLSVATGTLWSVGGFSFVLDDITSITENSGSGTLLSLFGLGTISGNGFDPTLFKWSFSVDSSGSIDAAFSSTNTPVPEPSIVLLLGTALLGFGVTRKFAKKA